MIDADENSAKFEFVVQECLNSGTIDFLVSGDLTKFFDVLTHPRWGEFMNPTKRFPNMKVADLADDYVVWSDGTQPCAACRCGCNKEK